MRKYYRAIDSLPTLDNVGRLLKLEAIHYSTMTSTQGTYRNFVMNLNDEELVIAKLSLTDVSINPLSDGEFNFLKTAGYIK